MQIMVGDKAVFDSTVLGVIIEVHSKRMIPACEYVGLYMQSTFIETWAVHKKLYNVAE